MRYNNVVIDTNKSPYIMTARWCKSRSLFKQCYILLSTIIHINYWNAKSSHTVPIFQWNAFKCVVTTIDNFNTFLHILVHTLIHFWSANKFAYFFVISMRCL